MFERFSNSARAAVRGAVEQAHRLDTGEITADHLALSLLAADRSGDSGAARLLDEFAVPRERAVEAILAAHRRAGLSAADAAALRELGIDVDAVVANVERTLGAGALAAGGSRRRGFWLGDHRPFTGEAKRVLEGSLRAALELGARRIGDEHILLALLSHSRMPADVLTEHGLTAARVRARLAQAG